MLIKDTNAEACDTTKVEYCGKVTRVAGCLWLVNAKSDSRKKNSKIENQKPETSN
jgi:hypothetical protein